MADFKDLDGIEVPQEVLDMIAGGVLDDSAKDIIRKGCQNWKNIGLSLKDTITLYSLGAGRDRSGATPAEVEEYITSIWDDL